MAQKLPTMMVRIAGGTEMRINIADFDVSKHERLGASAVPGTSTVPNIVTKNPLEGMSVLERRKKVLETQGIDDLINLRENENKLKEPNKEIVSILDAAIASLKA